MTLVLQVNRNDWSESKNPNQNQNQKQIKIDIDFSSQIFRDSERWLESNP
jgi:hypothetical protein